jgi:hypothetical protein
MTRDGELGGWGWGLGVGGADVNSTEMCCGVFWLDCFMTAGNVRFVGGCCAD